MSTIASRRRWRAAPAPRAWRTRRSTAPSARTRRRRAATSSRVERVAQLHAVCAYDDQTGSGLPTLRVALLMDTEDHRFDQNLGTVQPDRWMNLDLRLEIRDAWRAGESPGFASMTSDVGPSLERRALPALRAAGTAPSLVPFVVAGIVFMVGEAAPSSVDVDDVAFDIE